MNYNNEINMYLDDIKGYAKNTLTYLKDKTGDKFEIIMYLSSVDEVINNIKDELINYLYYLEDKIDVAYKNEANNSIKSFIASLKEDKDNE